VNRLVKRAAVVLIASLVGTAVVLAVFFQYSAERTLELAEALQFRRLLVARQTDQHTYRFFYATNRGARGLGGEVEDWFTNERGSGLHFGIFDTQIEPSLGIGMLIDPSDWFQNEEIQLRKVQPLEADDFLDQVRKQVDASPDRSLLININGFRERFTSALRKTAFLAHVLDLDSPMLAFDWPGDQGSTIPGYRRAQRIAGESGDHLAQVIEMITRRVEPDRLWVVANSLGGEVVVNAFSRLYEDPGFRDAETEITHVFLTAPDVSHAQFGEQFRAEISALADHLTVYVSSNDRALLMSRVLNRERRLGESTVDPANPDQSDEAEKAYALVEPGSDRVTLVDITPVNRTRNFHNFSLETPEFFDDLYLRLSNESTPRSRPLYRVRQASGAEYWILTRGR
jgi:esterase/lipase superfamily enzyme